MDDYYLDRYELDQQRLEKSQQKLNQRKRNRFSTPSSTEDENKTNSKQKSSRSDFEDGPKRSRLNRDRAEQQPRRSPNAPKASFSTIQQKKPPKKVVDEKKEAQLRACFDPDSDDDDPIAAIKKKQIARNRLKGWNLPAKRAAVGQRDGSVTSSPEKADNAVKQSANENVPVKQPTEGSVLPTNLPSETKSMTKDDIDEDNDSEMMAEDALSAKIMPTRSDINEDSDSEMMAVDDIPAKSSSKNIVNQDDDFEMMAGDDVPMPKSSLTKLTVESPMKRAAVRKADENENECNEMVGLAASESATEKESPSSQKKAKMTRSDINEGDESVPLTIVSWNISSAQSSKAAPDPELRSREAPRLIREEILRSKPDVIALQETAYPTFGEETFVCYGYVSMGSQIALHTDEYVDLLVKRELAHGARPIALQSFQGDELPAVAAVITLRNNTRVAIASLHLPHTKESAPFRKVLCGALMKQLTSQNCDGIILTGDFNMRGFEDKITEQLCGGQWKDAWKTVTNEDKETKFTWNGHVNMYHGPDNFRFFCRFDRCYVKGEKCALKHFDLIGNQPIDGKGDDFLSDHYGLVVKCDFASSDSTLVDDVVSSVGATTESLVTTTSKAAASGNSSLNKESNSDKLRAARLRRFENGAKNDAKNDASAGVNEAAQMRVQQNEVIEIDLTDDSEHVSGMATDRLESDRAMAERLQQEEVENARRSMAENAPEEVDYSSVRPGVFETMRDKRAYLQDTNTTQLSASQNSVYRAHVRGGVFMDTHPQAWSSGGWVWVNNPQYREDPRARVDTQENVARMSSEWNRLKDSKVKVTHRHVIELATKHNVLHGKWLLFPKHEDIETVWPKIRNAVIEGKLGSTAKIADGPDERGLHAVCIYCPSFLDKDELLRVRRSISNNVGMYKTSVLRFKLDATTYLNIYSKHPDNPWKLPTTSYACGGEKDEECSTLISSWEKCTCTTSDSCQRCYKPKNDSDIKDVYLITGLKFAETTAVQSEKVTLLREPENKHDSNAVKVVNSSGKLVGHIAKEKAAILSPRIKEMQEDLTSKNLELIVEGTITSGSDGYRQSVKVEFKEVSNEKRKDAEVEVIVLE